MPFDFKMNFFFIYDTSFCKADDEDPKDAVVVFFPVQGAVEESLLCCQLAGVAKFLRTTLSTSPAVVGFDRGKFALVWSGSYLLGLGADSDVSGCVLRERLVFLCGMFCFYHGDMGSVLRECGNNRGDFLVKLELCWSRYSALAEFSAASMLQHSHRAALRNTSKKGSSVTSIASRLLHACQTSSFVRAGAVFHNSRVVSTQLPPQLTRYLSLLSNSNASAPVQDATDVPKNLPPDVQLKLVYLSPECLSRILKLNHSSSRIRHKHVQSSFGSGSEADVDSGNGSESIPSRVRKDSEAIRKRIREDSECCSEILGRCGNRCLLSWTRGRDGSGRVDAKRESVFGAASLLLCNSHALLRSTSFPTQSTFGPTHLTSSVDAEFRCSLCGSHSSAPRLYINELSIKKWNSDCHISKMTPCRKADPKVPKSRSNSDSRFHRARRVHSSRRHTLIGHHPQTNGVSERGNDSCDVDMCVNIEGNDLQRHVLYVQRYGRSTLVLLLDKNHDEKEINYLWNGGFTALRELEFSTDRREVESAHDIEPPFYILLCDRTQRTLKEYPQFPSFVVSERHSRQTIQKMHEDFKMNRHLRTMCLLSSGCSVFASHTREGDRMLAFYLQPEANSRKVESLLHVGGRAARRLGKHFGVAV